MEDGHTVIVCGVLMSGVRASSMSFHSSDIANGRRASLEYLHTRDTEAVATQNHQQWRLQFLDFGNLRLAPDGPLVPFDFSVVVNVKYQDTHVDRAGAFTRTIL